MQKLMHFLRLNDFEKTAIALNCNLSNGPLIFTVLVSCNKYIDIGPIKDKNSSNTLHVVYYIDFDYYTTLFQISLYSS